MIGWEIRYPARDMSASLPASRLTAGRLAAAGFTAAYIIAATVAAVTSRNAEFAFYIVVMLILAAAIGLVHWRIGLSTALLWALAIWGGIHMAGGLVPVPESWPINGDVRVLYSWWIIPARDGSGLPKLDGWLKYDQLVHIYGFGVTTWLCWAAWRGVTAQQGSKLRATPGVGVLIAAAGCGFGPLNEIVEFIATLIAETNVGGYVNTGYDLIANTIGALLAATIICAHDRRQKPT